VSIGDDLDATVGDPASSRCDANESTPAIIGVDGSRNEPVWLSQPTFPGCHMMVRPVAVFWMEDEAGGDAKVLCVPARDPRFADYEDIEDLPEHLLGEIGNFFQVSKLLEPNKETNVHGWEGRAAAEAEITSALARYPH